MSLERMTALLKRAGRLSQDGCELAAPLTIAAIVAEDIRDNWPRIQPVDPYLAGAR